MFFRNKKKEPSRLSDPKFREEIKSEILPDLMDLYNTDVKMKDVLGKLSKDEFDETEVLPFCVSARNNYTKIGDKLVGYGADKEALEELNFYRITEIMKYVMGTDLDGQERKEYQYDRSNVYLGLSARFLQELGELVGIDVDKEVRMGSGGESLGKRSYATAPAYETIDEEPVHTHRLKDNSKYISDIFKYDKMYAGEISSILQSGLRDISKSGAPDDLIQNYISTASYFKDLPEDKMIPRDDSSINMLRKLSNEYDLYVEQATH